MANVNRVGCLAHEFADVSDFLMVYIEEAHPADGWSFKDNYPIKSHRSIDERIGAAGHLAVKDGGITVVVDSMTDAANRAYGGLFERLYIIQNGTVVYQGQRGPHGFRLPEVEQWLRNYRLAISQPISDTPSASEILQMPNPC